MDKIIIILLLGSKNIYDRLEREEILEVVHSLVEQKFNISCENLSTFLLILNNSVNVPLESRADHFERYIEIVRLMLS